MLGLAAAASLVPDLRVDAGTGIPHSSLVVATAPSGELQITPVGELIRANDLRPTAGEAASGSLVIRNQTGRARQVRARALPSSRQLDDALRVRVGAADRVLFNGRLGELRRWSRGTLVLASGEQTELEVRAWIPGAVGTDAWSGRVVDVTLELGTGRES